MKLVKSLFKLLLVLLIIIVLAAVAIIILIDPNDYKPEISEAVEKATGRELTIEGDLEYRLFPWLAVETGAFTLGGRTAQEQPLLKAQSVSASVRLLSLFSGTPQLGTIALDGLHINLITDANGKTNYDDLLESSAQPSQPAPDTSDEPAIAFSDIAITNAVIALWSAGESEPLAINIDALEISEFAIGESVPFSLIGNIQLSPQDSLAFETETEIQTNEDFSVITLKDADTTLTYNDFAALTMQAQMQYQSVSDAASITLESASFGDNDFQGELKIEDLANQANLSGKLTSETLDIEDLFAALQIPVPQTHDPDALRTLAFDMVLQGTLAAPQINVRKLMVDQTTINGNATLGEPLQLVLNIDELDLDRYLPKISEDPDEVTTDNSILDPDLLRALDVQGQLKIEKLKVNGLNLEDVRVRVRGANGTLTFDPIKTTLYGGNMRGNMAMTAKDQRVEMVGKLQMDSVQSQPLLNDVTGFGWVSGVSNFEIDIRSELQDTDSLFSSLTGSAALGLKDGAIHGLDLGETLARANAATDYLPDTSAEDIKTVFSNLVANIRFENGWMRSDDLNLNTEEVALSAKGGMGLASTELDLQLFATLSPALKGQVPKQLEPLLGERIPVAITGTLTAPEAKLDIEDVIKDRAKDAIFDKLFNRDKDKKDDQKKKDGSGVSAGAL